MWPFKKKIEKPPIKQAWYCPPDWWIKAYLDGTLPEKGWRFCYGFPALPRQYVNFFRRINGLPLVARTYRTSYLDHFMFYEWCKKYAKDKEMI